MEYIVQKDKEKILAFAAGLEVLTFQQLKTEEAKAVQLSIEKKLTELVTFIKQQAETL